MLATLLLMIPLTGIFLALLSCIFLAPSKLWDSYLAFALFSGLLGTTYS